MRFERRELEITNPGKWFLALSVILGTSAVLSGNNLLYLIECALLGGLILSGILSEHAIASLEFTIVRRPALAEETSRDWIRIRNRSRFTVRQVGIGEWKNGRFTPLVYLDEVAGNAELTLRSQERFELRGLHRWDALAISTRGPFGFARKTRVCGEKGERKVWPVRIPPAPRDPRGAAHGVHASLRPGEVQWVEDEVRAISPGEDARAIVWLLSLKGDLIGRRLSPFHDNLHLRLDLRGEISPSELERRIRHTAASFYQWTNLKPHALNEKQHASLEVVTQDGVERFQGAASALDQLAVLTPPKRAAS